MWWKGLAHLQKKSFVVSKVDRFGYILTQFITGTRSLWIRILVISRNEAYKTSAKIFKIHSQTKGGMNLSRPQTPQGVITPWFLYNTPLACIQQRGVIRGGGVKTKTALLSL